MRLLAALLALVLSGCTGASHDLAPDYLPLKSVTESSLRSGKFITTIGNTVYVNDLDAWLAAKPIGSPRYRAALRHEQVHSKRQIDDGVASWINRYLTDREFMWEEERRGWYEELQILRSSGLSINVGAVADVLASYENLAGQMVSRDEALAWVNDVLAGRWKPSP